MKPQEILAQLRNARMACENFDDASFVFGDKEANARIAEVTRVYRQSWIIAPLDRAIAALESRHPIKPASEHRSDNVVDGESA